GLSWTEVDTFVGQGPDARVFVTAEDDQHQTIVTFGDGVNGARLSTGSGNVVATYRFGAGSAAPPAGVIKQRAKPTDGIKSVVNPVGAAGGSDAETADSIKISAPRSALLLGRAVSMDDMQAAAMGVHGVQAASAEWRFDGARQRAVAKVW